MWEPEEQERFETAVVRAMTDANPRDDAPAGALAVHGDWNAAPARRRAAARRLRVCSRRARSRRSPSPRHAAARARRRGAPPARQRARRRAAARALRLEPGRSRGRRHARLGRRARSGRRGAHHHRRAAVRRDRAAHRAPRQIPARARRQPARLQRPAADGRPKRRRAPSLRFSEGRADRLHSHGTPRSSAEILGIALVPVAGQVEPHGEAGEAGRRACSGGARRRPRRECAGRRA